MITINVLQLYYSRLGGVRSLVRVQSSRLTRDKILIFSVLTLVAFIYSRLRYSPNLSIRAETYSWKDNKLIPGNIKGLTA